MKERGTRQTSVVSIILCANMKTLYSWSQPLLTHTDQPPVACSDQLIKLFFLASLWDGFFFCLSLNTNLKKEKHVPFCWDNHFDYGLRQSLYMKSHQIINIEREYC